MARPKYQKQLDDVVDRAVDVGVEAIFDRLGGFFQKTVEQQRAQTVALPPERRAASYRCTGCHQDFGGNDPALFLISFGQWGMCHPCHKVMWHAGNERLAAMKQGVSDFARNAARNAASGAPRAQRDPAGPLPHEVLGIDIHASIDEVKKAYRKLAGAAHPDRVSPDASFDEKARARAKFEEIQRAYDVMMKVRKVAT